MPKSPPTTRSRRAPRSLARKTTRTDEEIAVQIIAAISHHRLPPGTKLGEQRLGAIFGVSRTRVRQVLFRLATAKVITLSPNRGAFVARPTLREAREVFAARRVVESAIVALLVKVLTPFHVVRLQAHLKAEDAARAAHDSRGLVKLTGIFHVRLAELAGNTVLADMLQELVARSSLIIALYQSPSSATCPRDEHRTLLDAIARGEAGQAVKLMRQHLDHIERGLDLDGGAERDIDLKGVFDDLEANP